MSDRYKEELQVEGILEQLCCLPTTAGKETGVGHSKKQRPIK